MKKVLVINDESDTNLLITLALKDKGYTIDNSYGLQEGKKIFLKEKPDLLFLDINLPDGNGLDNISYFKQVSPDVKVCMISANDDVRKSHDYHADTFLVKPFSLSDIIKKTKELIG
jgi:DNA-binding response OmpR family regulator